MPGQDVKRKLTAILSADVKGYSRLMGEDEVGTICTLNAYKEVMANLIQRHHGRVVDAVQCAVEIQKELKSKNAELPGNRRMEFRIGVNLGDVVEEEDKIFGDGVNIAARLESLSEVGGFVSLGQLLTMSKTSSLWAMSILESKPSKTSQSRCGCIGFLWSLKQLVN